LIFCISKPTTFTLVLLLSNPDRKTPACLKLDLKTDNLMLSLEDSTMLADFAAEEVRQLSPQKKIENRAPYTRVDNSADSFRDKSFGLPILVILGR
jgi:hypothetical protein